MHVSQKFQTILLFFVFDITVESQKSKTGTVNNWVMMTTILLDEIIQKISKKLKLLLKGSERKTLVSSVINRFSKRGKLKNNFSQKCLEKKEKSL